ncbi:MAG: hypothetical protein WC473_00790 [Patescibacteria group bacterium]
MRKLLLIEFDKEARSALGRTLGDAGYIVHASDMSRAELGTAREALLGDKFDAIVIEPEMPLDELAKGPEALSGIKLLAKWREQGLTLPPIVALTWRNYSYFFGDEKLYQHGIGCVVDKIGGSDSLLNALECLWEKEEEEFD